MWLLWCFLFSFGHRESLSQMLQAKSSNRIELKRFSADTWRVSLCVVFPKTKTPSQAMWIPTSGKIRVRSGSTENGISYFSPDTIDAFWTIFYDTWQGRICQALFKSPSWSTQLEIPFAIQLPVTVNSVGFSICGFEIGLHEFWCQPPRNGNQNKSKAIWNKYAIVKTSFLNNCLGLLF